MIVGIGCDIVELHRIAKQEESFAKRILTDVEYEKYLSLHHNRRDEYLAGRFAAKEAIFKALPNDQPISKIEIGSNEQGKPYCNIKGYHVHISIAHEVSYAIAYAIIEKGLKYDSLSND